MHRKVALISHLPLGAFAWASVTYSALRVAAILRLMVSWWSGLERACHVTIVSPSSSRPSRRIDYGKLQYSKCHKGPHRTRSPLARFAGCMCSMAGFNVRISAPHGVWHKARHGRLVAGSTLAARRSQSARYGRREHGNWEQMSS